MRFPNELTTLEILGIAIQSEVQAARFYLKIKKVVRGILKDKLAFLINEEKRHEKILKELYHRQFPRVALLQPHHSLVPKPVIPQRGKVTIAQLFKIALRAEKDAESFYLTLARKMNDTQSTLLIKYLARVENSHYQFLNSELNLMEQGSRIKALKDLYQAARAVHLGA